MQDKTSEKTPKVKREGWNAAELAEEASNEETEDILRKMLRGDETGPEGDSRDLADTPKERSDENEENN